MRANINCSFMHVSVSYRLGGGGSRGGGCAARPFAIANALIDAQFFCIIMPTSQYAPGSVFSSILHVSSLSSAANLGRVAAAKAAAALLLLFR